MKKIKKISNHLHNKSLTFLNIENHSPNISKIECRLLHPTLPKWSENLSEPDSLPMLDHLLTLLNSQPPLSKFSEQKKPYSKPSEPKKIHPSTDFFIKPALLDKPLLNLKEKSPELLLPSVLFVLDVTLLVRLKMLKSELIAKHTLKKD